MYDLLVRCLLDFLFYAFVDVGAKSLLKDATSDEEKAMIWFYESLILSLVCLTIYVCGYVPYFLLLNTAGTFLWSQSPKFIRIYVWWTSFKSRFNDWEQLHDSMQQMPEQMSRPQQFPLVQQVPYRNPPIPFMISTPATNKWYPSVPTYCKPVNALDHLNLKPSSSPGPIKYLPAPSSNSSRIFVHSQQEQTSSSTDLYANTMQLTRRPLRSTGDSITEYVPSSASSLKSRLMSVISMIPFSTSQPPGIKNSSHTCFINCVIQCLARTPRLNEALLAESSNSESEHSALLTSFSTLINQCGSNPRKRNVAVLDPSQFLAAASELEPRLVCSASWEQKQQDSAEFLTWILGAIHKILNKKEKTKVNGNSSQHLKHIYGDIMPQRLNDIKEAYRREIELANGLDQDSYAEPMQRLSDLEWLAYKEENQTIVDSLFTGQLVDAFHCLTDKHISVNMQTFNILPVPIGDAKSSSGVVYLEECFLKYCNVEHLVGKEGLVCSFCNKVPGIMRNTTIQNSPSRTLFSTDATIMSPIPERPQLARDGFHLDRSFRTSTPISNPVNRTPSLGMSRLRDVQKRCLLRNIAECLIIQLMRFTFMPQYMRSKKVCTSVSVPLTKLDLSNIIFDAVINRQDMTAINTSHSYDLYGACLHLGGDSVDSGHYICYCLHQDKKWYKFDDDIVTEVSMKYEICTKEFKENVYLLFYRRK